MVPGMQGDPALRVPPVRGYYPVPGGYYICDNSASLLSNRETSKKNLIGNTRAQRAGLARGVEPLPQDTVVFC